MSTTHDPVCWSRMAPLYDLQLALERRALLELLALVDVIRSDRLLDIGTGTGAVLGELASSTRWPARAVGLDGSHAMLARAAGRLPPSVELVRADATQLPFDGGEFEVATCTYLLHLLDPPRRRTVLREALRVLAPGGRLGVVTVAPARAGPARALAAPLQAAARRSTGVLAGLRTLDPREELRAAGFELVAARRVRRGYPSLCVLARRRAQSA